MLTAGIATLYAFVAPYFFAFAFPQYISAIPYTEVYAITIALSMVLSGAYLESQVAIKEKYTLSLVASITTIVTTAVGVYFFGLWGAIIARIISRLVNVGVSTLVVIRH